MGDWEAWRPQFPEKFQNHAIYPPGSDPQVTKGTKLPDKSFIPLILENINEGNAMKQKICIGEDRFVGIRVFENTFVAKCGTDLSMVAVNSRYGMVVVVQEKGDDPRGYTSDVARIGDLLDGKS